MQILKCFIFIENASCRTQRPSCSSTCALSVCPDQSFRSLFLMLIHWSISSHEVDPLLKYHLIWGKIVSSNIIDTVSVIATTNKGCNIIYMQKTEERRKGYCNKEILSSFRACLSSISFFIIQTCLHFRSCPRWYPFVEFSLVLISSLLIAVLLAFVSFSLRRRLFSVWKSQESWYLLGCYFRISYRYKWSCHIFEDGI